MGSDVSDRHSEATEPKRRIASRRTVMQGVAWSVPTIVVAGALAPAFAASPEYGFDLTGSQGCKLPPQNRYRFNTKAKNTESTNLVIVPTQINPYNGSTPKAPVGIASVEVTGGSPCTATCNQPNGVCVPANSEVDFGVMSNPVSDMGTTTQLRVDYAVYDADTCELIGTFQFVGPGIQNVCP